MKISIIGTGYVGLVSGVCLANKGNEVICVDYDSQKIKSINNGISSLRSRRGGRFTLTTLSL